jgi:protein-S-isoprenylcysteine O-methyltransferase Ste14
VGDRGLFLRAVLAFVALPGTVAFLVPWLLIEPGAFHSPFSAPGLIPLAFGAALLFWCVRNFYAVGKGTLAPWAPPQTLVVTGPYRISRNPMYVGVVLILSGWALGFRSRALAVYALGMMIAFHLRVGFRRGAMAGADARRGLARLQGPSGPMDRAAQMTGTVALGGGRWL